MADDTLVKRVELEQALLELERYRIDKSRLRTRQTSPLGRGGFGIVRVADFDSSNGATTGVAVKELKADESIHPARLARRLAREMRLWSVLNHPNVLQFIGFHLNADYTEALLICPWYPLGNIHSFLRSRNPASTKRLQFIKDTSKGLAYLHTLQPPVCHGDLKSLNVLVNEQESAVLCDFGLAAAMEEVSGLSTSKGFTGSIRWCSPELLFDHPRTPESDMWAWGCLAYEILTGRIPYCEISADVAVIRKIVQGDLPAAVSEIPFTDIQNLLVRCWSKQPEKRPSARSTIITLDLQISTLWTLQAISEAAAYAESELCAEFERAKLDVGKAHEILGPTLRLCNTQIYSSVTEAQTVRPFTPARLFVSLLRSQALATGKPAPALEAYLLLKINTLAKVARYSVFTYGNSPTVTLSSLKTQEAIPDLVFTNSRVVKDKLWNVLDTLYIAQNPGSQVTRDYSISIVMGLSRMLGETGFPRLESDLAALGSLLKEFAAYVHQDDFRPAFANQLVNTYGRRFVERGGYQRATSPTREAIRLYRSLNEEDKRKCKQELATSLTALGACLSRSGPSTDLMQAMEEATSYLRDFANSKSVEATQALGDNLYGISITCIALQQPERAFVTVKEATKLYQSIFNFDPSTYMDRLTDCLQCMCDVYPLFRFPKDAVITTDLLKQTVSACQFLVKNNRKHFLPYLAGSLRSLSGIYNRLGRFDLALEPVQGAEEAYKEVARDVGTFDYAMLHAGCMNDKAWYLHKLGHPRDALKLAKGAVAAMRHLMPEKENPSFNSEFSAALDTLSTCLSCTGKDVEALSAAEEATRYSRLSSLSSESVRNSHRLLLTQLANCLKKVGRMDDAKKIELEVSEIPAG
ncbi:hypothetical protein FRB99_000445 [Tulasnella sp. 403]|nr:hypothetical protein FRB99_000445 [Tulasnella sp. 403]